jgi:hypothetical protein
LDWVNIVRSIDQSAGHNRHALGVKTLWKPVFSLHKSQSASQPITPYVAERFRNLIPVFLEDFIHFKGFVAGPAVDFDALSRHRQTHTCRSAGRAYEHTVDL